MKNLENKEQEIEICKEAIKKSDARLFTLKLALKGLLGDLSEFVLNKLVEISTEISFEKESLEFYTKQIQALEKEHE